MTNEMSNEEAKEIIIQERDSLKANPAVKVENCLYEAFDVAIRALEQQQKVGKWIKTYEPNDAEPFILWECSECQNTERGRRRRSKYCPNCGAKMEVDE